MLCTYFTSLLEDSHGPSTSMAYHTLHTPHHGSPTCHVTSTSSHNDHHTTPSTPTRGKQPKRPIDNPSGEHRGGKNAAPMGEGDDLHACMSRTRWSVRLKSSFWMRGSGGRSADWSNGWARRKGGGQASLERPRGGGEGGGGRGSWNYCRSISAVPSIPMGGGVGGFPTKAGSRWYCFLVELVDIWSGTLGVLLSTRSRYEGSVPCSRGL